MSAAQLVRAQDLDLAGMLPWPARDANKYSRGKAAIVAGDASYPGAACLCALAASRAGAGYVEAYSAPEGLQLIRALHPSAVARPMGELDLDALGAFARSHPCALVVGPGLSPREPGDREAVLRALRDARLPLVADGGALGVLASAEGREAAAWRRQEGLGLLVTPHEGEAATLARGARVREEEPAALAEALAAAYGCTVVLKGPVTRIAEQGKPLVLMDEGGPALAKAGTGDVLAGIVGGLAAQGLSLRDAAILGTVLHARAGQDAAERLTDICAMAEDVVDSIPAAVRALA